MSNPFIKRVKQFLLPLYEKMSILSLKKAIQEQQLDVLFAELNQYLPDLSDQYTTFKIDSDYLRTKVRGQHSFQTSVALKGIGMLTGQDVQPQEPYTIVDVGDSSGTHITYLKNLLQKDPQFRPYRFRFLSVNLDPVAVDKIRSRGMDAVLSRAEDLSECIEKKVDLIMSFQMLEHLTDPIQFLNAVSQKAVSDYFVVTVPYLTRSRVGLHHIRHHRLCDVFPENTHIFELSPDDWKLIFVHSGWEVLEEFVYRQYPRKSWLRLMKPIWKQYDFEGFYGFILKINRRWSACYKSSH